MSNFRIINVNRNGKWNKCRLFDVRRLEVFRIREPDESQWYYFTALSNGRLDDDGKGSIEVCSGTNPSFGRSRN